MCSFVYIIYPSFFPKKLNDLWIFYLLLNIFGKLITYDIHRISGETGILKSERTVVELGAEFR